MYIRTDYLSCIFDPTKFRSTVNRAIGLLTEFGKHTPFDTIAFTGVSGAAIAFPLSFALEMPLLCIRKKGENNHSPYQVEGNYSTSRYVIVDDFISTGSTVHRIEEDIKAELPNSPELVGIYLYKNVLYCEWPDIDGNSIPIFPEP